MWNGIKSSKIDISNFSEVINITEDGLHEIAHRVVNLWCTANNMGAEDSNYGLKSRILTSVDSIPLDLHFINNSGDTISSVNLYNFYSP